MYAVALCLLAGKKQQLVAEFRASVEDVQQWPEEQELCSAATQTPPGLSNRIDASSDH
jgi:hypothetical protein